MSEPPSKEVKVPHFKDEAVVDDWRIHLYNQERFLQIQGQMVEVLENLLKQQGSKLAL